MKLLFEYQEDCFISVHYESNMSIKYLAVIGVKFLLWFILKSGECFSSLFPFFFFPFHGKIVSKFMPWICHITHCCWWLLFWFCWKSHAGSTDCASQRWCDTWVALTWSTLCLNLSSTETRIFQDSLGQYHVCRCPGSLGPCLHKKNDFNCVILILKILENTITDIPLCFLRNIQHDKGYNGFMAAVFCCFDLETHLWWPAVDKRHHAWLPRENSSIDKEMLFQFQFSVGCFHKILSCPEKCL